MNQATHSRVASSSDSTVFQWRPTVDQFGLVEAVDGFGQGVVVGIALATNGRLDAGLCQSLGITDGNVLRPAIRMMDQAAIPLRLAGVERLLQGIQNKVGTHRTARPR